MRVAYFLTHPIQYQSPMIRALVAGGLDIHVGYGCQASGEESFDPGFKQEVVWDTPLLEGYPFRDLQCERQLGETLLAAFLRARKAAIAWLIEIKAQVVWIHGWGDPFPKVPWFSLACMAAAKSMGLPVLLRGETNDLCLRGGSVRRWLHGLFLRAVLNQVRGVLAVGSANREFYLRRGMLAEELFLVPYSVDTSFFQERCAQAKANHEQLRRELGVHGAGPIVLYVGRMAQEKAVGLLMQGFQRVQAYVPEARLVLVGVGPQKEALEALAAELLPGTVYFAGFRNQSELPAFYAACDVFVLPSSFEPWGLVVNEVMCAGKPVIVSDAVGSGADLVKPGVNGDIFRSGDADDLCAKLLPFIQSRERREAAGAASLQVIEGWGFAQCLVGVRQALDFVNSEGSRNAAGAGC
jgi:glycosyltransferase involved in cell wall biosynthesis